MMTEKEQFSYTGDEEHAENNEKRRKELVNIIEQQLRSVVADRLQAQERVQSVDDLPNAVPISFESELSRFTHEQLELLQQHSVFLEHMNGHKGAHLRALIQHGNYPESTYLKNIHTLSEQLTDAHGVASVLEDLGAQGVPPALQQFCEQEMSEYALAQYIALIESGTVAEDEAKEHTYSDLLLEKTATVLGTEGDKLKWINLMDQVFVAPNKKEVLTTLLRNVGSLSDELMNKRKFTNKYKDQPEVIIETINLLRTIEHERNDDNSLSLKARAERAKVINHLLNRGVAENIRNIKSEFPNITLDTNGIFIRLKGFETHLPYGLIDANTLAYFEESLGSKNPWVTQEQLNEMRTQRFRENSEITELAHAQEQQEQQFIQVCTSQLSVELEPPVTKEKLVNFSVEHPEHIAALLVERNMVIPDTLITTLLMHRGDEGVYAAMKIGECVGNKIMQNDLIHENLDYFLHHPEKSEQKARDARIRLLNHPQHYSALKIVRALLKSRFAAKSSKHLAIISGKSKKLRTHGAGADKHQSTFIEVSFEGKTARVLIDENKHLNTELVRSIDSLIQISAEEYPHIELMQQALHHFGYTIDELEHISQHTEQGNKVRHDVEQHINNALYFLLAHFSSRKEFYEHVSTKARLVLTGEEKTDFTLLKELVTELQKAHAAYLDYYYHILKKPEELAEHVSPKVRVVTVPYTKQSLEQMEHTLDEYDKSFHNKNPIERAIDQKEYEGNFNIKVALLNHHLDSVTETIPHAKMREVLEVLGIEPGKPFINVIGGLRKSEKELHAFAETIVNVIKKLKGNAGIPPIQSGISEAFARANISLQQYYQALGVPIEEQAHMFSIAPGGNVWFEGNPFLKPEKTRHIYGLAAVPSIITPRDGEWDREGYDRITSPYKIQIAYMEQLYKLIAHPQANITTVANGGFNSLEEIEQALPLGFNHMFIQDTDRIAALFPLFYQHLEKLPLDDIKLETAEDYANKNQQPELQRVYNELFTLIEKSAINGGTIKEFLEKDFGENKVLQPSEPRNDDYEVYRKQLVRVLQLAQQYYNQIYFSPIKSLEQNLLKHLEQG